MRNLLISTLLKIYVRSFITFLKLFYIYIYFIFMFNNTIFDLNYILRTIKKLDSDDIDKEVKIIKKIFWKIN